MKKAGIILAAVVLAAVAGGGYYYYKQKNAAVNTDDLLRHTVVRESVTETVSGSGKIESKDRVSIYLNVSQVVSKVHVKEGDRVKAGDVLVEYDMLRDYADLSRRLTEAEIQLQNAQLSLRNIAQSAGGNELVQYQSDVTTAQKNIADAEADVISAQKNVTDAEGDLSGILIKISQQQLRVDDAKSTMDRYELLLQSGGISSKSYDDSVLAYKSAVESLNDLMLQREIKEKTLETRKTQLEYSEQRLGTRKTQSEYAQQKLDNSQNKLADETTRIQYNMQQNIISLNEITIDQIKSDIDKLTEQSISPIDGSVTSVNASDGGTVSKGEPVITLSDSKLIVKFEISEYDAPAIELGQKAIITTSAIPDKIYGGTVTKISEEAIEKEDSSNNEVVVPIEISIDNPDDKLKAGYSVDIEIIIHEAENVVAIPIKALAAQNGRFYVYILRDGELIKSEVTPGFYGDRSVEILSGLSVDDVVILNPEEI